MGGARSFPLLTEVLRKKQPEVPGKFASAGGLKPSLLATSPSPTRGVPTERHLHTDGPNVGFNSEREERSVWHLFMREKLQLCV